MRIGDMVETREGYRGMLYKPKGEPRYGMPSAWLVSFHDSEGAQHFRLISATALRKVG